MPGELAQTFVPCPYCGTLLRESDLRARESGSFTCFRCGLNAGAECESAGLARALQQGETQPNG
jgi:hypothetical protein